MTPLIRALRRFSEAVAALFMLLIFATFILQVAVRYSARLTQLAESYPILDPGRYGWTLEFCLALWVWLIFWGNAFVVRQQDHVSFDILYHVVPRRVRLGFIVITGLTIGIGFLASIEPTLGKFSILRLKQTATLDDVFGDWIRMRDIYSIYILFLLAVGLRALWSVVQALRGRDPEAVAAVESPDKT